MRIASSVIRTSPLASDFARLHVAVTADRRELALEYWIDLPADLAPRRLPGDALVLMLLPLACYFDEDIVLDEPVDALLHENLKGVQHVWRSWYPRLSYVQIHAPVAAPTPEGRPRGTLSSFSGGIDSFFSLLRHRDRVTHLLSIAGFNTPMDDLDNMRRDLGPIAQMLGKRHVPVRTNIRYGDNPPTPYSITEMMCDMAHGCLLAAFAHLMQDRFDVYLIPATHHYARLHPYGSHPLTDPLFSSASLRVVHDGAAFDRIERTEFVARSDEALSVLHVCTRDFNHGNCSTCQKCLRTMATLDLVGARERARSFDWSGYSLDRVATAWLPTESERSFFIQIARAARAQGRLDLAQSAETAIATSQRRARQREMRNAARLFLVRTAKSNPLTRSAWNGLKALRDRGRLLTAGKPSA
jgi:hypothetical protein